MYNRCFLLCVLAPLFIVILSACSLTAAPASTPTSSTNSNAANVSAQAVPSAGKGNVAGRLFQIKPKGDTVPLASVTVYLGTIKVSSAGKEMAVTLDRIQAPKAVTNAQGNFVFTDITPGRYGLMVDTPTGAALLNNPDTGSDLIVEVVAGQTMALGELKYTLPF